MIILKNFVKKITPKFLRKLYHEKKYNKKYSNMTTSDVFRDIKNTNFWYSSESISGSGSEIEQTKTLITELPNFFKEKNIKSILDIPCGDFNWMRKVDLSEINYLGGDIIDELISENIEKYGSERIKFMVLNILTDVLPKTDLIFVRDCFVHFSNKDIQNAISIIKKSGCKYLMATTFINNHKNIDIITGKWRPVNLQDAPFNFPEPEYILVENCTEFDGKYKDKSMGLWLIEKL